MKKILISILLGLFCVNANADEDVMLFFLNDGSFEGFYRDEIDSISYSHYDEDSIWHSEVVMQNIWLRDSVCKIPIDMIDSIRYELPKTEYKSNVIRLDERYTPYISSSDGMSVTFSSNLPASLRPNEGDVLLYEGSSDIFPNGFAGKVTQSGGGTVSCDSVSVEDVYERLYFFGRYLLVEKENNGVKQYSVRRVKKGKNGNVIDGGSDIWGDYGDDWGILDNGNGTNVSLPPVTLKQRFDFTKYGISLGTSLSFSAEFTIQCSMVFNIFEPSIFYKCEETDEINGKFEVSYGWEGKPKSDPFIPFKESEVTKISLGDPDKDGHVDWMIVDKDIPVPECPVLTVGAKVGLFMDPKVEAKALMDIETTIKKGYVFSYNLNKQNWRNGGEFVNASLPSEITSDVSLEGKVGGSIWAGILCGVNVGFGTSDKGVKENATVKLGPYLDAYLDLNVLDGISDYSWYSALKDSKMKWGIKWGVDVDFTAALKGLFSYKWTQLSIAPKKLIWEKDLYLFPSFEAPTYSVHGDKLLLFSNLTRLSVPNYVGIRLVDETGKETTKWLDEPYWIGWGGDGERPFPTSFIFEGLDFKNHRYTAIPVTRIWKFPILSIPEPAQTCITCTDSNHPHLIDLGLPSGTKWLCTNLYANEPHASGGFYQWGNKYQENSYDNTYSLPPLGSGTIQGTTYDAATSNLGESYVTPTQQQFEELLAVCNVSEKKSPWDFLTSEGIYLKAPNGANLYLPFAGYKDGTKVASKGHGHYMLADYTNSNWIKYPILHLYGTPLSSYSSEAGYYGYSVRPVSCQNVTRLALSAQTLTLGLGKSETIEITSGSGNYVFERSDDSVIDVRLSGNTLLVKGLKLGTATITVYDRGTGQSEKVEVTVTNEASSLALSTQTLTLTPGKSEIVDVTSGSGSYAAVSNATNVATVTVEGSKLVIKGVAKGTATITVKDNQTQEMAKIEVTVNDGAPQAYLSCPDDNHPHLIDLGLPSGTKWACCNVGATKPEVIGDYYAWGEIETKDNYTWNNYIHCNGVESSCFNIGEEISGTIYDVAHMKWKGGWRMPTKEEIQELIDNCNNDEDVENGIHGWRFSRKEKDNSIFIPYCEYEKEHVNSDLVDDPYTSNGITRLWSSSIAPEDNSEAVALQIYEWQYLIFSNTDKVTFYNEQRDSGLCVRPVYSSFTITPLNTIDFGIVPIDSIKEERIIIKNTSYEAHTFHIKCEASYYFKLNDDSVFTLAAGEKRVLSILCIGLPYKKNKSAKLTIETDTEKRVVWLQGYGGDVSYGENAYALMNWDDNTLVFYYDDKRDTRDLDLSTYNLNIGDEYTGWPSWSVKKVVFDPSFAKARPTTTYGWFRNMEELTTIEGLQYLNTSEVTNMAYMFYHCSSLMNLDLSSFNTSRVKNMGRMFLGCEKLTSLNLSKFDTSNVTDMSLMFQGCASLTNLDLRSFNTSNVTNMGRMFISCSSLTNLNISNFNTSNVTDMHELFQDCSSLKSLDLSSFDTSNVTDMSQMFDGCSSLTSLDLSKFETSKVTNMVYMFLDCSSLTNLNLRNFNTSSVTNMRLMFQNCSSLVNLDISNFNTLNVTNTSQMFYGCSSLTNLDISTFNTSKVTNMTKMFYKCSHLKTIYSGNEWTTDNVEKSADMFSDCLELKGGKGTSYNSNHIDKEYARIDGGTTKPGYFTAK